MIMTDIFTVRIADRRSNGVSDMREIIFKAKRKDNGEWVNGYLMDENYINVPFNDYDACGRFDDPIEINPETLCQYTGLTDKNGRKIWESDIVKHEDSQCSGAIRWYRGDYVGWCVDDVHDYEQQFSIDMFNECEVIGNIFDNVDLLEVE